MAVHICMLVLALTNCIYEKNLTRVSSLFLLVVAVVECSTRDQVVPGLSPIACLFVYLFVCSFVFIMGVT